MNVSPLIESAVASGKVTYAELATVLSVEDLHDVLEIVAVGRHNDRVIEKRNRDS